MTAPKPTPAASRTTKKSEAITMTTMGGVAAIIGSVLAALLDGLGIAGMPPLAALEITMTGLAVGGLAVLAVKLRDWGLIPLLLLMIPLLGCSTKLGPGWSYEGHLADGFCISGKIMQVEGELGHCAVEDDYPAKDPNATE